MQKLLLREGTLGSESIFHESTLAITECYLVEIQSVQINSY